MNIVQATLAFREGELLRLHVEEMLKVVDKIIILLDNYDNNTLSVSRELQDKYKGRIILSYSTVKRTSFEDEKISGRMNKRFKIHEGEIREQLLDEVKILNDSGYKVDILTWLDADEIPTIYFKDKIKELWKNDKKKAMLCNYIQVFDSMTRFSNRLMYDHLKVIKFSNNLKIEPIRSQHIMWPLVKHDDCIRGGHLIVHLADYGKDYRKERSIYKNRPFRDNEYIWEIDKDVKYLTSEEYCDIINNKKPLCSVNEFINQRLKI